MARIRGRQVGVHGVQYLDKIEGTKATFVCKARGHKITQDFSKGPVHKRMPESALRRFARYWGLRDANGVRHGHCYGECKACACELGVKSGVEVKP